MYKHKQGRSRALVTAAGLALVLSACGEKARVDPALQIGGNPTLPASQDFLVPPMQVPKGVGWKGNAMPAVAPGLQIE
jgi:hypothetical protein